MAHHKRFGTALAGLALFLALVTEIAFAQTPIASSKHNLSASGPGTVKAAAGGTSEICVFCHTPHGAITTLPGRPLWNKTLSTATYTTYTSTYLQGVAGVGGLNYPTATLGNSSKLCLSCHDGTVAIGSVANTPGSGTTGAIGMTGVSTVAPVGALLAAATSNLGGANLADDHPIGYLYRPGAAAGQDPDLVVRAWPWKPAIKVALDPDTSAGTVECKSCHDPHNNQYTKFLRVSNLNAALCKTCHGKPNYALSGHDISTQTYNQTATTETGAEARTNVRQYSCLVCHRPHAGAGAPLLRAVEENTCYNAGCHGALNPITGNTTIGSLNISGEMTKARNHPTNTLSNLHKDLPGGESPATLGGSATRHAECYDCHNPHQAQPAVAKNLVSRVPGGIPLRISAALKGAWGVEPNYAALTPTTPVNNSVTNTTTTAMTFTKVGNPAINGVAAGAALTDEYQVCFKCHSAYVTLPGTSRDIAAQANPKYSSYHGMVPLVGLPTALVAATQQNNATNFFVNQNTMAQPWAGNAAYTAVQAETCRLNPTTCATFAASRGRVWCSDCHNNNSAPLYPSAKSTTIPSGPHGSTLAGVGPGTSNTDKMLIATIASTAAATATPLCLRCHLQTVYTGANFALSRAGAGRVHTNGQVYRGGGESVAGCFTCHMWDRSTGVYTGTGRIFPHGMNKKWVNVTHTGVANAVANQHMVDSFIAGYQSTISYSAKTCATEATTCGSRSGGY